jgi:hypothetical protein
MQAIKENNLFDAVAKEGYTMSKDNLITIIKELEYVVYDNVDVLVKRELNECLVDTLSELWEEDSDGEL